MSSGIKPFHYGSIETLLGKPFDPVYAFMQLVPFMIAQARGTGLKDAHSYRDFHVAGSVYAINMAEKMALYDAAGNLKRSGQEKVCAEKKLLGRLNKTGMTHAIGLVVLGTTDRAEIRAVSDLPTPTLHFCSTCRADVPAHPAVHRSTIVVTTGLEDDVHPVFTVGQIEDMYARAGRGDIDERLFKSQPDFIDWEQRLATYARTVDRLQEAQPSLEIRQGIAQMALSKELTM